MRINVDVSWKNCQQPINHLYETALRVFPENFLHLCGVGYQLKLNKSASINLRNLQVVLIKVFRMKQ